MILITLCIIRNINVNIMFNIVHISCDLSWQKAEVGKMGRCEVGKCLTSQPLHKICVICEICGSYLVSPFARGQVSV